MKRTLPLLTWLAATAGSVAFAQTDSPVLAPAAQTPAPAEMTPPPTPPKRSRVMSPEAAAALAATRPKYNPPKPVEKIPEEEMPDLREVDKPKNTIVRLPKYVVRAPKPPVFTERDVNTKEGLEKLAVKRYSTEADKTLNAFTLPLFGMSAEARAMAQYDADERLKNMSDLKDTAREVSRVNKAESSYLKREVDQTYLRSSEFGLYGNGTPK